LDLLSGKRQLRNGSPMSDATCYMTTKLAGGSRSAG